MMSQSGCQTVFTYIPLGKKRTLSDGGFCRFTQTNLKRGHKDGFSLSIEV